MKARKQDPEGKNVAAGDEPAAGEAQPAGEDPPAPKEPNKAALTAVTAMVRNTATIGHHVLEFEKWDLERDLKLTQQIQIAEQKVAKVANEAGLSPEVEKSIRDALMEIKP